MKEFVILVDQNDQPIGTAEKMDAHRQGLLHRAFSVFIFDPQGRMLVHQRAFEKYHSGGLWTNACCSHPRPNEDVQAAAHRRLGEELGFDCPLEKQFSFIYRVELTKDGLIEHKFDHVFFGTHSGVIHHNKNEVAATAWVELDTLATDVVQNPHKYTYWFTVVFKQVLEHARSYCNQKIQNS